ncbi:hypothetical protein [Sorangium sp. So ce1099]|uniref:hypothetical protein n=1 Tax=Sorangium sp. So ce1099 TaxID=3133331 RepID=UPI003F5E13FB
MGNQIQYGQHVDPEIAGHTFQELVEPSRMCLVSRRRTHGKETAMQTGTMLASVVLVAGVILFGGCMASVDEGTGAESNEAEATQEENVGEAEQTLNAPCSTACDCPLGNYCASYGCGGLVFGPPPPEPYCYADCQCAWYQHCESVYGGTAGFCRP